MGSSGLLLGSRFAAEYGGRIRAVEAASGVRFEPIALPRDPEARLAAEDVARIELACFSVDVFREQARAFFAAASAAEGLRWLHLFNTGTDHPIFRRFLDRGVLLTNSPGANARPIAQSAIAGLLALARRLPDFAAAQQRREWLESESLPPPADLGTQTLVLLGVGSIGREIARLARALGLHVIGVRRSPGGDAAAIDEWCTPDRLAEVLPRADWLAIACPLTDRTRGLLDADALARLPEGARLLNVARGEIVDEAALARALAEGRLGGAYLDVFEVEPLPATSPLWSLPNVLVTPHASSISAGSAARQAEIFLANLERWARGRSLDNRVLP